jgi:CRISPR-associated protein Cmr3
MTTSNMNAHSYLIEPLAPLVFRSGKPFGPQSGADAALFPMPSSLAGLLRTVLADQQYAGQPLNDLSNKLRQTSVRGPLLARYTDAASPELLVAKPADAMYVDHNGDTEVVRLLPKALDTDCGSDLRGDLLPVQMVKKLKGKPKNGPQYWSMADFLLWQSGKAVDFNSLKENGLDSLPNEQRTHVAISNETFASDEGKLFQTSGLDFGAPRKLAEKDQKEKTAHNGWRDQRLGFWAQSDAQLNSDLVTFGGERRLSQLSVLPDSSNPVQSNTELAARVRADKGIKLTFLTPAIFTNGYLPAWLDQTSLEGVIPYSGGLRVKLKACAIERWQAVSGFDLKEWKPKVMRKAVAAGAVYWFEVLSDVADTLHQSLWFAAVSDDAQDQRDGFGMVLPAEWKPAV